MLLVSTAVQLLSPLSGASGKRHWAPGARAPGYNVSPLTGAFWSQEVLLTPAQIQLALSRSGEPAVATPPYSRRKCSPGRNRNRKHQPPARDQLFHLSMSGVSSWGSWRGQAEWSPVAESAKIQPSPRVDRLNFRKFSLRPAHNVGRLNVCIGKLATFLHFSLAIPFQETGRLFARYYFKPAL